MKRTITLIVIASALLSVFYIQQSTISKLKEDKRAYQTNTNLLLQDIENYKTNDSLNVAKTGVLELKIKEWERYRSKDAELIKTLKIKNRKLSSIANTAMQTQYNFKTVIRDSLVLKDSLIYDTLKCISITSQWYDLEGCINNNQFEGNCTNRDSLTVVQTTKYKRFLGFLWRTNKVKDREVDVFSKNPNTKILGVEFIEIRK